MSDSDDEDEFCCPLCIAVLDESELKTRYCPCGYKICTWCRHIISNNLADQCPNCRTVYRPETMATVEISPATYTRYRNFVLRQESAAPSAKGKRAGHNNNPSSAINDFSSANNRPNAAADDVANGGRVVVRNLVCASNLHKSILIEDDLKKNEFFGQYGKITRISIPRNQIVNDCGICYVSYSKDEEAKRAIEDIEGVNYMGHVIHAEYGTARFCHSFLRGFQCKQSTCSFLHSNLHTEPYLGRSCLKPKNFKENQGGSLFGVKKQIKKEANPLVSKPTIIAPSSSLGASIVTSANATNNLSPSVTIKPSSVNVWGLPLDSQVDKGDESISSIIKTGGASEFPNLSSLGNLAPSSNVNSSFLKDSPTSALSSALQFNAGIVIKSKKTKKDKELEKKKQVETPVPAPVEVPPRKLIVSLPQAQNHQPSVSQPIKSATTADEETSQQDLKLSSATAVVSKLPTVAESLINPLSEVPVKVVAETTAPSVVTSAKSVIEVKPNTETSSKVAPDVSKKAVADASSKAAIDAALKAAAEVFSKASSETSLKSVVETFAKPVVDSLTKPAVSTLKATTAGSKTVNSSSNKVSQKGTTEVTTKATVVLPVKEKLPLVTERVVMQDSSASKSTKLKDENRNNSVVTATQLNIDVTPLTIKVESNNAPVRRSVRSAEESKESSSKITSITTNNTTTNDNDINANAAAQKSATLQTRLNEAMKTSLKVNDSHNEGFHSAEALDALSHASAFHEKSVVLDSVIADVDETVALELENVIAFPAMKSSPIVSATATEGPLPLNSMGVAPSEDKMVDVSASLKKQDAGVSSRIPDATDKWEEEKTKEIHLAEKQFFRGEVHLFRGNEETSPRSTNVVPSGSISRDVKQSVVLSSQEPTLMNNPVSPVTSSPVKVEVKEDAHSVLYKFKGKDIFDYVQQKKDHAHGTLHPTDHFVTSDVEKSSTSPTNIHNEIGAVNVMHPVVNDSMESHIVEENAIVSVEGEMNSYLVAADNYCPSGNTGDVFDIVNHNNEEGSGYNGPYAHHGIHPHHSHVHPHGHPGMMQHPHPMMMHQNMTMHPHSQHPHPHPVGHPHPMYVPYGNIPPPFVNHPPFFPPFMNMNYGNSTNQNIGSNQAGQMPLHPHMPLIEGDGDMIMMNNHGPMIPHPHIHHPHPMHVPQPMMPAYCDNYENMIPFPHPQTSMHPFMQSEDSLSHSHDMHQRELNMHGEPLPQDASDDMVDKESVHLMSSPNKPLQLLVDNFNEANYVSTHDMLPGDRMAHIPMDLPFYHESKWGNHPTLTLNPERMSQYVEERSRLHGGTYRDADHSTMLSLGPMNLLREVHPGINGQDSHILDKGLEHICGIMSPQPYLESYPSALHPLSQEDFERASMLRFEDSAQSCGRNEIENSTRGDSNLMGNMYGSMCVDNFYRVESEPMHEQKMDRENIHLELFGKSHINYGDILIKEDERKDEEEIGLHQREIMEEKVGLEKIEHEQIKNDVLESERLEQERLENERREKERLEKERAEYERREKERVERERLEHERLENERLERERIEKERLEAERLEKERIERERREIERLEKERMEKERLEKERLERERLERERLERERLERERLERERLERERLERERLERERLERERLERERLERERFERERLERERFERERLERERLEKERMERERLERERFERERLERERLEKERQEKEKAELERLDKERLLKEKIEKERVEKERIEAERLEKQRIEQERQEREFQVRLESERHEQDNVENEGMRKISMMLNKSHMDNYTGLSGNSIYKNIAEVELIDRSFVQMQHAQSQAKSHYDGSVGDDGFSVFSSHRNYQPNMGMQSNLSSGTAKPFSLAGFLRSAHNDYCYDDNLKAKSKMNNYGLSNISIPMANSVQESYEQSIRELHDSRLYEKNNNFQYEIDEFMSGRIDNGRLFIEWEKIHIDDVFVDEHDVLHTGMYCTYPNLKIRIPKGVATQSIPFDRSTRNLHGTSSGSLQPRQFYQNHQQPISMPHYAPMYQPHSNQNAQQSKPMVNNPPAYQAYDSMAYDSHHTSRPNVQSQLNYGNAFYQGQSSQAQKQSQQPTTHTPQMNMSPQLGNMHHPSYHHANQGQGHKIGAGGNQGPLMNDFHNNMYARDYSVPVHHNSSIASSSGFMNKPISKPQTQQYYVSSMHNNNTPQQYQQSNASNMSQGGGPMRQQFPSGHGMSSNQHAEMMDPHFQRAEMAQNYNRQVPPNMQFRMGQATSGMRNNYGWSG